MPLDDARRFVTRMREDRAFRNKAGAAGTSEKLSFILNTEKLSFDRQELVGAMAECMAQMDEQNKG